MHFQVGLCIVILVAATSAERGDLRIYGSRQFGVGFLLLNENTTCFTDKSFGAIEGSIACRQLGFTSYVVSSESRSEEKNGVVVLRNSSCSEEDTKLIDCMDVKFMDIAELPPGFECITRQLSCSNNSAPASPYPSEDKGSSVDKETKADIGRYSGGSIICSARVMAVFTVIAVWNVLYG